MPLQSTNVLDPDDATTNDVLEHLAARRVQRQTAHVAPDPARRRQQREVPWPAKPDPSLGLEFLQEARQQSVEDLGAASEEDVEVPRLRNAFSERRLVRERVTLDEDHFIEPLREDASGEQSAKTAADHDCRVRGDRRGSCHHENSPLGASAVAADPARR